MHMFVCLTETGNTVPFYRLYNGTDHYYTTSIADRDQKILGFDFDSTFNNWNSNFKYRNVNYTLDLPKSLAVMAYNYDTNQIKHIYTQQNQDYTENILQYTINSDFKIEYLKKKICLPPQQKTLRGVGNLLNFGKYFDFFSFFFIDVSQRKKQFFRLKDGS